MFVFVLVLVLVFVFCNYVEFNIPFSSGTNSAFKMSRTKSVGGGI